MLTYALKDFLMNYSSPTEGFRLAYNRIGSGAAVVLLHGWPGDRADYRKVVPLLADSADVISDDTHAGPARSPTEFKALIDFRIESRF
jgi:pimeloyl-ACP methyl ester carboxylesterase